MRQKFNEFLGVRFVVKKISINDISPPAVNFCPRSVFYFILFLPGVTTWNHKYFFLLFSLSLASYLSRSFDLKLAVNESWRYWYSSYVVIHFLTYAVCAWMTELLMDVMNRLGMKRQKFLLRFFCWLCEFMQVIKKDLYEHLLNVRNYNKFLMRVS